jgi:hypothetical protein
MKRRRRRRRYHILGSIVKIIKMLFSCANASGSKKTLSIGCTVKRCVKKWQLVNNERVISHRNVQCTLTILIN